MSGNCCSIYDIKHKTAAVLKHELQKDEIEAMVPRNGIAEANTNPTNPTKSLNL